MESLLELDARNSQDSRLYEITQLINSLLGVAVLPYEMFKDDVFEKHNPTEEDKELQRKIKESVAYEELEEEILKLYRAGKWKTTYEWDLINGEIKRKVLVFHFLEHLRNATCHCGDDAMGILPLSEGKVIQYVIFYDTPPKQDPNDLNATKQEFAMRLNIDELRGLLEKILALYQESELGIIDKTHQLKNAEKRVNSILGIKRRSDLR